MKLQTTSKSDGGKTHTKMRAILPHQEKKVSLKNIEKKIKSFGIIV